MQISISLTILHKCLVDKSTYHRYRLWLADEYGIRRWQHLTHLRNICLPFHT